MPDICGLGPRRHPPVSPPTAIGLGSSPPANLACPRQADGGRAVIVFFALACAFSWSYWIPLALGGPPVERGDMWPTHLPGLLGPMLAAFVWHATYNVGAGTDGGGGLVAPVMTACVIFWAVSLVQRDRSGLPALGCPTRSRSPGAVASGQPPQTPRDVAGEPVASAR